ncbi:MAG: glycosyltransferase family 4 protein [Rhodocyclales bacterium]|nr:glycosyltransferase family 4 protein [Rhodocyclales bacterium]
MTLLQDALDRTLREAQCARRWHTLLAIWLETREPAARRSVLDLLARHDDGDPRSAILRLTFLARASGDVRFENAAAARVLAMEPGDPDRLAAFMAYRWLNALQSIADRADFVADLSAGLLPAMARRLMLQATARLPPGFVPLAADAIRRVAVVLPYVGHRFHTPSMMGVEQAIVLARAGCQTRIFSAQELTPPDAALFRGDGRELLLPPLDAQAWSGILPAGLGMTIADSRYSLPGRWASQMAALAAFDPDVVLAVGLYSPLAAALYALRPVAGISVNTVPPIAPLDVWLTADPQANRRPAWGGAFAPPQPVYHPYRIKRASTDSRLSRAALGLDETALVWITAGFRLKREIEGEWASRMLQLMARHPRVVWLLVGGDGELPPALRQAQAGRVRALATRDDLPGVFRCCDIYVNPPRMGGGFSVAEAMAEGLPVTAFANSDGGDKLGELALPDLDAYLARLAALSEDPDLRRSMGQALRQRFDQRLDLAASGPALLAACRQAADLARDRLTKSS